MTLPLKSPTFRNQEGRIQLQVYRTWKDHLLPKRLTNSTLCVEEILEEQNGDLHHLWIENGNLRCGTSG